MQLPKIQQGKVSKRGRMFGKTPRTLGFEGSNVFREEKHKRESSATNGSLSDFFWAQVPLFQLLGERQRHGRWGQFPRSLRAVLHSALYRAHRPDVEGFSMVDGSSDFCRYPAVQPTDGRKCWTDGTTCMKHRGSYHSVIGKKSITP